jgi:DNA-binding transcriptional LysR family regulator
MQKRLALRPALEYPSVTACGALVAAGLGITALPRLALGLMSMEGLAAVPLAPAGQPGDRHRHPHRAHAAAGGAGLRGDGASAFRPAAEPDLRAGSPCGGSP